MVTREIFADEKSKQIFDYRFNYYQTGNMEYILEMILKEYRDFSRRVKELKEKVCKKLSDFNGDFIIYGVGVHAGLTMEYLKRNGLDNKVSGYCISKNTGGGVCAKTISEIESEKNKCMVLVPEGVYSSEMVETLENLDWDSKHYCLIPFTLIFDNDLNHNKDVEEIIRDRENHFIVYGTDWSSVLFRDLMKGTNRHFDFSIAELPGNSMEDLSYVASMKNLYVVVFNGLRRKKALEAGVPEEKIIQFCSLDELQYFDADIVPKHIKGTREVFIDGGSLNLYSSCQFLQWCDYECDKVIAFEPDRRCVKVCEEALTKLPKLDKVTELVPKGLWSDETELVFNEVENYGSSSFVTRKGTGKVQVIPTTSIDIVSHGEPVTFIKMDIEGAELEALKGAQDTIKKYHPTLAISIYHKPEDIVELPAYIKSIDSKYKLYLRNYHLDHTETVLYAVHDGK